MYLFLIFIAFTSTAFAQDMTFWAEETESSVFPITFSEKITELMRSSLDISDKFLSNYGDKENIRKNSYSKSVLSLLENRDTSNCDDFGESQLFLKLNKEDFFGVGLAKKITIKLDHPNKEFLLLPLGENQWMAKLPSPQDKYRLKEIIEKKVELIQGQVENERTEHFDNLFRRAEKESNNSISGELLCQKDDAGKLNCDGGIVQLSVEF